MVGVLHERLRQRGHDRPPGQDRAQKQVPGKKKKYAPGTGVVNADGKVTAPALSPGAGNPAPQ